VPHFVTFRLIITIIDYIKNPLINFYRLHYQPLTNYFTAINRIGTVYAVYISKQGGTAMRQLQLYREHYLNPLHIYCRLCDLHVSKNMAIKVSKLLTTKL